MGSAAQRMQALIEDLLQLFQITAKGQPFQKVNLKEIACEVIEDLDARIIETQGDIKQGFLPPAVYLSSQPNKNGDWSGYLQENYLTAWRQHTCKKPTGRGSKFTITLPKRQPEAS